MFMTASLDSSSWPPFKPFGRAIPNVDGEKREDSGKGERGLGDTLADAIV
jgi:hypothetical protein